MSDSSLLLLAKSISLTSFLILFIYNLNFINGQLFVLLTNKFVLFLFKIFTVSWSTIRIIRDINVGNNILIFRLFASSFWLDYTFSFNPAFKICMFSMIFFAISKAIRYCPTKGLSDEVYLWDSKHQRITNFQNITKIIEKEDI